VAEFVVGFGELLFQMKRTGENRPMLVTIGFKNTVAPTTAQLNTLHQAFDSRFNTVASSVYSCDFVRSRYQATATAVTVTQSSDATTIFAGGTDDELINSAVVIRKATTIAGRKNRGRFYMPGVLHGNIEAGGQLTATALSNWQFSAAAFFTDLLATLQEVVINHGDLSTPTTVLSFEVNRRLGTQRRRLEQGVFGTP
jgi:hypothetical protein